MDALPSRLVSFPTAREMAAMATRWSGADRTARDV